MSKLALPLVTLPAMRSEAVEAVRRFEAISRQRPQIDIPTQHLLHAGMYARTIRIPAGLVMTGALIKRATVLIVSGDCSVYTGEQVRRLTGYCVLPGCAGRKQVFRTYAETHMTMLFPTNATTAEEAEEEFTDEAHNLMTRRVKGEATCLEQ